MKEDRSVGQLVVIGLRLENLPVGGRITVNSPILQNKQQNAN
jgi:hypothetical protein